MSRQVIFIGTIKEVFNEFSSVEEKIEALGIPEEYLEFYDGVLEYIDSASGYTVLRKPDKTMGLFKIDSIYEDKTGDCSFQYSEKKEDGAILIATSFYNGGCDLTEILEEELEKISEREEK